MRLLLQPSTLRRPDVLFSKLRNPSSFQTALCLRLQNRSFTADQKPPPIDTTGPGPNQEQLLHVSEEAAATAKIKGEDGPDLEQGTPVQEILQGDKGSQEKIPKILQDELKQTPSKGSRQFSTSSRSCQDASIAFEGQVVTQGHIFDLPALPLPSYSNLKYRYDPVIKQVTNLMMRDGKLSKAQRNMAVVLHHLRTASPPTINPQRPLIASGTIASHLPLDPVRYLTLAIDSVAPLMRMRSQKGAAGGGVALQIPVPLGQKQRRRQAVMWILDAASKRPTKGSGRDGFAQKVAEELIAVAEGKSGVWDRRGGVHKLGVSARANLKFRRR